jgi:hypothetical protein
MNAVRSHYDGEKVSLTKSNRRKPVDASRVAELAMRKWLADGMTAGEIVRVIDALPKSKASLYRAIIRIELAPQYVNLGIAS